jgi:hypothetical protein
MRKYVSLTKAKIATYIFCSNDQNKTRAKEKRSAAKAAKIQKFSQ